MIDRLIEYLNKMLDEFKSKRIDNIRNISHTLKGSSNYICAKRLTNNCDIF